MREKYLIGECYGYGVSPAHASSKNSQLRVIYDTRTGLIEACADNFDAQIFYANALNTTLALALLLTRDQNDDSEENRITSRIRRINKTEMADEIEKLVIVQYYKEPQKPGMPA